MKNLDCDKNIHGRIILFFYPMNMVELQKFKFINELRKVYLNFNNYYTSILCYRKMFLYICIYISSAIVFLGQKAMLCQKSSSLHAKLCLYIHFSMKYQEISFKYYLNIKKNIFQ